MTDLSVLDRHEKIAFSYSGGKDSTAALHFVRKYHDRMTVYHTDTGDLLPEMVTHVARVTKDLPHYVRIETNVTDWIAEHGLPADLVPYSAHPVGQMMGEPTTRIVSRYTCCWSNLMAPTFQRMLDDNNTLIIRGTKAVDMNRLPVASGDKHDNAEFYYPLQDWSNEQVRLYLLLHKIDLPPLYDYFENAPECARCSAWWNEGRAAFLRAHYPDLFQGYDTRLQLVINEIAPVLANLRKEAGVT